MHAQSRKTCNLRAFSLLVPQYRFIPGCPWPPPHPHWRAVVPYINARSPIWARPYPDESARPPDARCAITVWHAELHNGPEDRIASDSCRSEDTPYHASTGPDSECLGLAEELPVTRLRTSRNPSASDRNRHRHTGLKRLRRQPLAPHCTLGGEVPRTVPQRPVRRDSNLPKRCVRHLHGVRHAELRSTYRISSLNTRPLLRLSLALRRLRDFPVPAEPKLVGHGWRGDWRNPTVRGRGTGPPLVSRWLRSTRNDSPLGSHPD